MPKGIYERRPQPHGSSKIDARLDQLLSALPAGVSLSQMAIAEAVGCSNGYIGQIERSALKKIKAEFERRVKAGTFSINQATPDRQHSINVFSFGAFE